MKLMIVSRGLPSVRYPMNGIFEFDQAKALARSGVDVIYVAIDLRSIRRSRKMGYQRTVKDGVICYSANIPVGALPSGVLTTVGRRALSKIYDRIAGREGKPDIIHAHFTTQGYIASFLAEREDIPLIITEHSSLMNSDDIKPAMLRMAKRAYAQADRVIAVGNSLAARIKENTGVTCEVIPNIVDTSLFSYREEQ